MNPETTEVSPQVVSTSLQSYEFLTTKELMKLLKIKHRQTIYDLIEDGMPAIAVGRNYRFLKSEVIDFLRKKTSQKIAMLKT